MIKDRQLEDRVINLGFKQNPYKYIKNASLLVLSSDREGLPTIVIESLILGTPVVSTDCPTGPSEILTGDLAYWLVPVQNPSVLAAKIDKALDMKINIQDKNIYKFDKEYIYQEYKRLWEK
jgi:glycosyltransferase involved in cell wall biosynthesis